MTKTKKTLNTRTASLTNLFLTLYQNFKNYFGHYCIFKEQVRQNYIVS